MKKEETENNNDSEKKSVSAIILKNPEVAKQIELLKDAAEIGVKKTGKGLIIFYERSTRIGEIVKDIIFVLFGLSILLAGVFTTPADLFAIWKIVATLENGLIGRIIVIIGGLGLFTYSTSKLWNTLKLTVIKNRKEETYVQKKLSSK
ncbi:TPA: hypothetical protein H1016_02245 [archaeon]|uniref:Uncharacterized protein n=1 Tax=Candidatus Naiadarchaeum limnaeum TaxID=2756139 RepID=A0A832UV99_9ARCH|nr:hypothetical protein [Candidatus Naiadarchaeum limnaeum]